jgi:hypothetical protein
MSVALFSALLASSALAREVNITVDAANVLGDLPPVARFFGADEPNQGAFGSVQPEDVVTDSVSATYPNGEKLIHDLGNLGPHQTYFRTHNLLTTCDPPNNVNPKRLKWGCTNVRYHKESVENEITDLGHFRHIPKMIQATQSTTGPSSTRSSTHIWTTTSSRMCRHRSCRKHSPPIRSHILSTSMPSRITTRSTSAGAIRLRAGRNGVS